MNNFGTLDEPVASLSSCHMGFCLRWQSTCLEKCYEDIYEIPEICQKLRNNNYYVIGNVSNR